MFTLRSGSGIRRRGAPRHQGGAIGLMAALVLLLVMLTMALAIDAGRLYMEQRGLQRIADMAALETARHHTGCHATSADAAERAQRSAERNGFSGDLRAGDGQVQLGALEVVDGLRVFELGSGDPDEVPEAVRVVATEEVPSSVVLGGLLGGTTALSAEAVAQRQNMAGISAGSWAARISAEDSVLLNLLLNELLGSDLDLDAVAYRGLADTSITLLQLADDLRVAGVDLAVGTVDELLTTSVSVLELVEASISAVDRQDVADVDLSVLEQQLLGLRVDELELELGDLLHVEAPSDPEAALDAELNVLELILMSALTATGEDALNLELELPVDVPGLAMVDAGVSIELVEPPQMAIGPPGVVPGSSAGDAPADRWRTHLETAQARIQVDLGLGILGGLEDGEGLNHDIELDLGLAVQAARGEAWLEGVSCPDRNGDGTRVDVGALPGLASVHIGRFASSESDELEPSRLKVLGLAEVDLQAEVPVGSSGPETLEFLVTDRSELPTEPLSTSSGVGDSLGHAVETLGEELILEVRVLPTFEGEVCDGLLGGLLCGVADVVNEVLAVVVTPILRALLADVVAPLLNVVGEILIDPLLDILGVKVGGMDVQVVELREGGVDLVR
ncbi:MULTISPECIES: TadG family pilus assembly protein [unclassified Thioalkalivibrio]|uniref:TadG family pilus assembly protein n=1 Tax=unclassified Thioalkalivibrio TaxID=2621013 RepID=UPI001E530B22|nr:MULTISPECIES: TadG family pilus assembly protein [unclassified Thioalkalivibrio]